MADENKRPPTKNIVVVGSPDCGKSHLIKAFIEMTDCLETARNYCDIALCDIEIDETNYSLMINEAPCRKHFQRERSELYENAEVVLVCFAVDDMSSYLFVTQVWYWEKQRNCPSVPLILVGNKCDLRSEDGAPNTLSYRNGLLTARNIKAYQYVECSANTKEGILEVFIAALASLQ